jgi:hypothetical protein
MRSFIFKYVIKKISVRYWHILKYGILLYLSSVLSFASYSQNYEKYYFFINKGECEAYRMNHENSLRYYDSAFYTCPPLPLHLQKAYRQACAANDSKNAIIFLSKLSQMGVDITNEIDSKTLPVNFCTDSSFIKLSQSYKSVLDSAQSFFDLTYIGELKKLVLS